MTIQDLGAIGEFLGAIILIISVIYLAVQVRHAGKVAAIGADQDRRRMFQSWNDRIILSSEFAEIWNRGLIDPASLSQSDRNRFDSHVHDAIANTQSVYFNGFSIGSGKLVLVKKTMRQRFSNWPFLSSWWDANKHLYHPDFVVVVDEIADNEDG